VVCGVFPVLEETATAVDSREIPRNSSMDMDRQTSYSTCMFATKKSKEGPKTPTKNNQTSFFTI
jgi:hypothetical protein